MSEQQRTVMPGCGEGGRGKVPHCGGDLAARVAVAPGTGCLFMAVTQPGGRGSSAPPQPTPPVPTLSQRTRNLGTLLILLLSSSAHPISQTGPDASTSLHDLPPAPPQQPPHCLPASLLLALPLPVDDLSSSPQQSSQKTNKIRLLSTFKPYKSFPLP